jgi:hypothetical protein
METIKISLVDNDFVVHAKAELSGRDDRNEILDLLQHLNEDFIQGQEAFIEVEGLRNKRTRFAVSQVEA